MNQTATRPYAEVIGDPIAHSKSPLIHNFWAQKLGLGVEYSATHVTAAGLSDYIEARRGDPLWRGCNITKPHKVAVLDHINDPGGIRTSIGAANTVARSENGALFGTNTDAGGFYLPIADLPLEGQSAIVIGAGGAARAVLFALARCGIADVTLLARNPLAGAGLLAHFGLKGSVKPMAAALPSAALLVNTTPLGMEGHDPLTIDVDSLDSETFVYDLVYAPLETKLIKAARARGLEAIGGLEMLIGQARIAFELFFDAEPPAEGDDELRALLIK